MVQLASFARFAACVGVAVALSSACGGQSFESAGEAGGGSSGRAGSGATAGKAAGGSNAGGSASGGATSGGSGKGGSGSGAAGSGSGGFAAAGSGSGGAGAGSGGSTMFDEACDAPPVAGPCDAAFPRWYSDPTTGICRPFIYGGCGGNKNNYETLAECQGACSGGPQFDACQAATDCIIAGTGCCGVCDGPGIRAHDLIAYNRQHANQFLCGLAGQRAAGQGGGGAAVPVPLPPLCAQCPAPAPGQGALKYFVPDCVRGQCVVTDLRSSQFTACRRDDDCKVRHGNGCCEACSNVNLLAVSSNGAFEKLVCGAMPPPCPPCVPPPSEASAVCGSAGHCELSYPAPAQP